jgi:hypothetical protein
MPKLIFWTYRNIQLKCSIDENVFELLLNKKMISYPDVALVVTDVENLKRNLLLLPK